MLTKKFANLFMIVARNPQSAKYKQEMIIGD